jgi:hypothetical protein
MSQRQVDIASGLIGSSLLTAFIIGLAHSISTGSAGFWGGLPFWIISVGSLCLVWYDFWDSCVRDKR